MVGGGGDLGKTRNEIRRRRRGERTLHSQLLLFNMIWSDRTDYQEKWLIIPACLFGYSMGMDEVCMILSHWTQPPLEVLSYWSPQDWNIYVMAQSEITESKTVTTLSASHHLPMERRHQEMVPVCLLGHLLLSLGPSSFPFMKISFIVTINATISNANDGRITAKWEDFKEETTSERI